MLIRQHSQNGTLGAFTGTGRLVQAVGVINATSLRHVEGVLIDTSLNVDRASINLLHPCGPVTRQLGSWVASKLTADLSENFVP